MTYRVALGQILVEGGRPVPNLDRAVAAIATAAEKECRVVVLPECLDLGWAHPSALDAAQPVPGPHSDRLAHAARKHQIYVAAGLVEAAGPHRYNAAVLFSPQGDILLHHRKINELAFALDIYDVGDRLAVVDCELGRVGLTICADNLPGSLELAGSLCRMGAQLILSPSAWAVDADHDEGADPYGAEWLESYGELAYLYNVTVVGVSNVGAMTAGAWAGRICIGRSLCVDSTGVLARAPYGVSAQSITVIEIEPQGPPARGVALSELVASRRQEASATPI
jgi:predicted amidohydrolase